jgi:hypothetical protein
MGLTAGIMAAGSGLYGAYTQSQAAKAQAGYQEKVAEMNARQATESADDAKQRGRSDAADIRRRTKSTVGAQRAALAAQGIDVDSGSAIELQDETEIIGEIDMTRATVNAMREAFGYNTQAIDYRSRSQFNSLAARNVARNTMITGFVGGGSQIASGYGDYTSRRMKVPKSSGGDYGD